MRISFFSPLQYRDGAFICDLCKKSFSDGNDMVAHWKSHVKQQQQAGKGGGRDGGYAAEKTKPAAVLPTAGPRKLTQLRAGVPSRRSRLAGSAERTPRRSRKAAATRASPAGQLISFGQPDAARKLRCVSSYIASPHTLYLLIHCIESGWPDISNGLNIRRY